MDAVVNDLKIGLFRCCLQSQLQASIRAVLDHDQDFKRKRPFAEMLLHLLKAGRQPRRLIIDRHDYRNIRLNIRLETRRHEAAMF